MPRATAVPLPAVRRVLAELGRNVRLARLRRKLSAELLAERAGMTRPTLRSIERGEPSVTLGALANVLHSLGLETDLRKLAEDDELGRKLQDAELEVPTRARRSKKRVDDGPA
ncbi:MAG TPA: helix-turn-helix transcriptional regulator [Polyangiales bacterium]|nr:helix-turn-helix transcriptional regulator [Polyangiales bacterium]